MCDLSTLKTRVCHGSTRNRVKPVKLTKWELPLASSTSYWEGVCAEIEKKYKRVRDPYPSLFPIEPLTPSITQQPLSDDIKFKISPPSPLHSTDGKTDKNFIAVDENHRLPPLTPHKRKTLLETKDQIQIYSKKSCPQHKNAMPVKIFDDEITKYLQRSKSSVPQLPSVWKCERHQALAQKKSTSASSSRSSPRSARDRPQIQALAKAPKLGTASLLPSFAKAVSTDSSVGTRESFDSGEQTPKAQDETITAKRDFLRVPNLSFVSSHPSFRKLSFVDSCDEEDNEVEPKDVSEMSEKEFVNAKKSLESEKKNLSPKDDSIEKNEKINQVKTTKLTNLEEKSSRRKITDYERKYAFKALNVITKYKHKLAEVKTNVHMSDEKLFESSEESMKSEIEKVRKKKRKLKSDEEVHINYKEIHKKMKEKALMILNLDHRAKTAAAGLIRPGSVTIYTSSRSTSGLSVDFENDATAVNIDPLQNIPKTKVFQRAYLDKCHSCMYKAFNSPRKVKRELPLSTLKSIIDEAPDFRVSSGSSSSSISSALEILKAQAGFDTDDEEDPFQIPKFELSLEIDADMKNDSKDLPHPQVLDNPNLLPVPRSIVETSSSTSVAMQLSREALEQQSKDRSMSGQSSERSRTSTPSNQSTDSEESRLQEDEKIPNSKFMAPCHAPIIWRKSFEPLRALKLKKFQSIRARAAALTAKSSEESADDSAEDEPVADEVLGKTTQESQVPSEPKSKKVKKKKLVKMKTLSEKMMDDKALLEEEKAKKSLKRAKTSFDLRALSDNESKSEESEKEEEDVSIETSSSKVEKQEKLPYDEVILMHRAGSPPPPIMPTNDVLEIIKDYLKEEPDFTASDLMKKLSTEFISRMKKRWHNEEDADELKRGLELFEILGDSRRYLESSIFDPNLEFSHKQPPLTNSRQLRRILSPKSYELVAPILGMPLNVKKSGIKKTARIWGEESSTDNSSELSAPMNYDLFVHPPTIRSTSDKFDGTELDLEVNPYALFLKKPQRKAVVWRSLREEDMKGYDPEATLEMRAARIMDRICKDFCDWMAHLGNSDELIDEDTLKDMFEINFTAEACKAMQVILRPLPTVPEALVTATACHNASELASTRRQIRADQKMLEQPKRTFAFGTAVPKHLRFVPSRKDLSSKWLRCEHIPKDLETMDVLWKGIVQLDSVQSFITYLMENPVLQISTGKLLKNLLQRNKNTKVVPGKKVIVHKETESIVVKKIIQTPSDSVSGD